MRITLELDDGKWQEWKEMLKPYIVSKKKVKGIEERMQVFADSIKPYIGQYGRDMCLKFYYYWSEMSPEGKKMRFEMQKTFSTPRRLATWYSNAYEQKNALTPEMRATLPDIFNGQQQPITSAVTLSDRLMKKLHEQYNIEGDDGRMYATWNNAKNHIDSLDERIQKELERKRQK